MARVQRRYRKKKKNPSSPAPRGNPTAAVDILESAAPAFAAFAATRFGTRIASQVVAKHKPSLGKHAGALASVGAFFAAWLLAHRVKWLHKHHTPIVVGSAIAALQSLIQIYIPRLGWMVSDATPELAAGQTQQQQLSGPDVEVLDEDPSMYTYNDAYDSGRYQNTGPQRQYTPPGGPGIGSATSTGDDIMDAEIFGSAG